MTTVTKALIVLALAGAIVATVAIKAQNNQEKPANAAAQAVITEPQATAVVDPAPEAEPVEKSAALPKLVDLGADKCIPCKAMAPILEELKTEYAGTFEVQFIDVWKNPNAGQEHGIRTIPTQIFYGADGKEIVRHEGFISKESILTVWKELGVL
jgi:thioredoxin 1